MDTIELLAPAGDLKRLKIALLYGADAVYIGGQQFSLRSRASNFSLEDIRDGAAFAREHGKKVHVTVNMLPHEDDLGGLDDYVRALADAGVHAPVSYTHLDVYKRQVLEVLKLEMIRSLQEMNPNVKIHDVGEKGFSRYGRILSYDASAVIDNLAKEEAVFSKLPKARYVTCLLYTSRCV